MLIWPLIRIAIILPLLLLFIKDRAKENFLRILSFALCYCIYEIALTMQYHVGCFNIIGGNWNWDGKLYGIVCGIAAYFIFRKQFKENNFFTLRQKKDGLRAGITVGVIIIAAQTAIGVLGNIINGSSGLNTERLLFQISMPGIDEEIMFRGVLLGLLCSSLRSGKSASGNPANWIIAILFGLVHALNYVNGSISFNTATFIWTGAIGYGLGYITLRTRSILIPILAHNLCNFFNNLASMI